MPTECTSHWLRHAFCFQTHNHSVGTFFFCFKDKVYYEFPMEIDHFTKILPSAYFYKLVIDFVPQNKCWSLKLHGFFHIVLYVEDNFSGHLPISDKIQWTNELSWFWTIKTSCSLVQQRKEQMFLFIPVLYPNREKLSKLNVRVQKLARTCYLGDRVLLGSYLGCYES